MKVLVYIYHNGGIGGVYATGPAVLLGLERFLEECPESRPIVERAIADAEAGEQGDLGDGDYLVQVPVTC